MNNENIDMSYRISDYVCPMCKSRGMDILMENMGNRYICPICRSSYSYGKIIPQNIIEKINNSFIDDDSLNDILSPHPNCSYLNNILIEITWIRHFVHEFLTEVDSYRYPTMVTTIGG